MEITKTEFDRIRHLKFLDIQQCSFCHQITILNLGWEPFKKLLCQACQKEHVLCPKLCLKVARNILGCDLYMEYKPVVKEIVKPNKGYDWANCYLCSKELEGASKKGVIKNRNNPSFWGIKSEWKVLCLKCLGKRFYEKLSGSKRKTFGKYVRRGYV